MDDDLISVALDVLLACVCEALNDADDSCPCAVHQTAGAPLWDRCCDSCSGDGQPKGQLSGHLVSSFPYEPWPTRVVPRDPCRHPQWAADVAIVLARCLPEMDSRGRDPSVEALDAAGKRANREAELIRKTLTCCPTFRVAVTQVQPSAVQGCVGIGVRLLVDLADRSLRLLAGS